MDGQAVKVAPVQQKGKQMKKLIKIITAEAAILWVLSGLTLYCDSWIPFWAFIITTIYLSLVAHATLEWKGETDMDKLKKVNKEIRRLEKKRVATVNRTRYYWKRLNTLYEQQRVFMEGGHPADCRSEEYPLGTHKSSASL